MNWYYQNIINNEKGEALAQVKRGHIAQLPIKKINPKNASEKLKYDSIIRQVDNLLQLNKDLTKAKLPNDKKSIEN